MRLKKVIGSVLKVEPETLNDESNSGNTSNWDSLRHIEVVFAIESAFHVRFSMPEIAGLRNLGDIRRLLIEKGVSFQVIDQESEPLRRVG
jgi:acyl carrier protein